MDRSLRTPPLLLRACVCQVTDNNTNNTLLIEHHSHTLTVSYTTLTLTLPHHSSFVSVYASASWTPPSMNIGTQYKVDIHPHLLDQSTSFVPRPALSPHLFPPTPSHNPFTPLTIPPLSYQFDKKANWWIHCMTSNYLRSAYI